jgi:hypothetical protein
MPDTALPWILVAVLAGIVGFLLMSRSGKTERPAAPVRAPEPAARMPEPEPDAEPSEKDDENAFFYVLGCGIGFYRSGFYLSSVLAGAADALLADGHSRRMIDFGREIWEEWFGGEIVPDRLCKERIAPVARHWPDARKDTLMTGAWIMLLMDDPDAGKNYVDPNAHENLRLEMTAVLDSLAGELYGADKDARMASVRARAAELAPAIFAKAGLPG